MTAVSLTYVSDRKLIRDLVALILAQDSFARNPYTVCGGAVRVPPSSFVEDMSQQPFKPSASPAARSS